MDHFASSTTQRDRTFERSDDALDKSNPLHSHSSAETSRPEHHRRLSGPPLENQRHALLSLRASLRGIAEASLAGSAETTSASPDSADLASEIIEQDVAVSLLGNAADTLDQIESALQRIEDGCYGRCAECQTRIPSARLEAIPYATCCVECASRRERAA